MGIYIDEFRATAEVGTRRYVISFFFRFANFDEMPPAKATQYIFVVNDSILRAYFDLPSVNTNLEFVKVSCDNFSEEAYGPGLLFSFREQGHVYSAHAFIELSKLKQYILEQIEGEGLGNENTGD